MAASRPSVPARNCTEPHPGFRRLFRQHVRREARVRQHAVEYRRGELLGACGRGVPVECRLRLCHERPEPGSVPRRSASAASCTRRLFDGPRHSCTPLLEVVLREGERLVQVSEDPDGVLVALRSAMMKWKSAPQASSVTSRASPSNSIMTGREP